MGSDFEIDVVLPSVLSFLVYRIFKINLLRPDYCIDWVRNGFDIPRVDYIDLLPVATLVKVDVGTDLKEFLVKPDNEPVSGLVLHYPRELTVPLEPDLEASEHWNLAIRERELD